MIEPFAGRRPSVTSIGHDGRMQNLLQWFYAAGTAGAARNASAVLVEQRRAELAVDALALRLEPARSPRRNAA